MPEYRNVRLPEHLCAATEKAWAGTFQDLESLLTFLLQGIAENSSMQRDLAQEQVLEQRLRDLGYI